MKGTVKWLVYGLLVLVIAIVVLLAIDTILPTGWKLSPEVLLLVSSAVLSLSFTYIPAWRVDFASLDSQTKVYINLGLVTLITILMFAGTCTGWVPIAGVVCSTVGAKGLFLYLFVAVGGNQLTYVLSAQPADVIAAKNAR